MRFSKLNRTQRSIAIALCTAIITFNTACTVTVIPPVNPLHPTVVYLCDYGVHSSLLLPVAPGRYVEYLYGDWDWAALCKTGWLNALHAIFWSNQAALGRRYLDRPAGETMPIPPGNPKSETPITVNDEGCQNVLIEMAARWENDRVVHSDSPAVVTDFWYVKDDQHYNWLHDCNLSTADLLKEMGCQIRGYAIWSDFKIKP